MTNLDFKKLVLNQVCQYVNSEKDIAEFKECLDSLTYNKGVVINESRFDKKFNLNITDFKQTSKNVNILFSYKSDILLGQYIYHQIGSYYIVDPSSIEQIKYLAKQLPLNAIVLDMCAAPGGKTILLALLRKDILIVSNEVDKSRVDALRSNINRLGLTNVIVTNNTIDDFCNINQLNFFFDGVILDVPCSGSGMIRKNELTNENFNKEKVDNLIQIQRELLIKSKLLVKSNGYIVYSTCSFSVKEDEENIQYFLANSNNFNLINVEVENTYAGLNNLGRHILFNKYLGEGLYFSVLQKEQTNESTNYIQQNKINLKVNISKDKKSTEFVEFNCFSYDSLKFEKKPSNSIINKPENYTYAFKDNYFLLDRYYLNLKDLNLIQPGISILNTFKNENNIINQYVSHTNPLDLFSTFEIDDETDLVKYLKGETIKVNNISNLKKDITKNLILITYKNIGIGFGKLSNNEIKNFYPKVLRRK